MTQSLPSPPTRLSRPFNPKMSSLPPRPKRLSAPLVPMRLSGPSVPILVTASATPLATKRVRAMVANNNMVRLIMRPPLCRGAKEERCQTPAPLRNEGSILLTEGDVCPPWHKVRQSTKKRLRTSQKSHSTRLGESLWSGFIADSFGPPTMPRGKRYWRHEEDQSGPNYRG